MNSIEKLQEKILEEAKKRAEENISRAVNEAKTIRNNAKTDADKRIETVRKRALEDADNRKARILAAHELEGKKLILKTKQDIVANVLAEAVLKIKEKPLEEYREILTAMIVSAADKEDADIVFSEHDQKRLGEDFEKTVNKKLDAAGKGCVKISSETRNIDGGFILKKGNIEINNSFKAIINMKRYELSDGVVRILFKT